MIPAIQRANHLVDRFRLRELSALIAMFIIVAGTWGFIELADEVFEGDTQAFDQWLVRSLREPNDPAQPIGPAWLAGAAIHVDAAVDELARRCAEVERLIGELRAQMKRLDREARELRISPAGVMSRRWTWVGS